MNLTVLQDSSEQIHYNNPCIPIYVRRGNLRSFSNMAALCHWHDDVELLLTRQGYLNYNINGSTVRLAEGSAIFVNSRQMHFGYSADGTDCEYVCITFRPQLLCGNEELVNQYVFPVLSAPQVPYLLFKAAIHEAVLALLDQIDTLYDTKPVGYELSALSCLFALQAELYQYVARHTDALAAGDSCLRIVRKMLDYIRTHYAEHITLEAIANAGCVCRTRCCQMFKQYLNMSPIDYLNSFRLEKGMELLKQTDLSITEISSACGFSSPSYFAERFLMAKGCTPTQYRRD